MFMRLVALFAVEPLRKKGLQKNGERERERRDDEK